MTNKHLDNRRKTRYREKRGLKHSNATATHPTEAFYFARIMREGAIRKDAHTFAFVSFNLPRLTASGVH